MSCGRLRPQIVHTSNLTTLVTQIPATLAGVPVRIHGEHGRDMLDLDGSNVKYQRVRRMIRPFVHEYIALSRDLETYLLGKIGVARPRVTQIYNGVDTDIFRPAPPRRADLLVEGFGAADRVVVGTVGRLQAVKDQVTLVRAFVCLLVAASQVRSP